MTIITTTLRPIKGIRGYYKAQIRHGINELLSQKQYTLGIIYHVALN